MSSTAIPTTTTATGTGTKPVLPHPLHQIAESPSHKLLLKQWLREQDLTSRRAALQESRLAAVRRDIASLYCAFFVLHSLLLSLLLLPPSSSCSLSWAPILASVSVSMSLVWAVRYKTDGEAQLEKLLVKDREDSLLLMKCVEELRRKGMEFDLLVEVDALRRAKSLRLVEAKGPEKVRRWSASDAGMLFLFAASCAAVLLNWFFLCVL